MRLYGYDELCFWVPSLPLCGFSLLLLPVSTPFFSLSYCLTSRAILPRFCFCVNRPPNMNHNLRVIYRLAVFLPPDLRLVPSDHLFHIFFPATNLCAI